MRGLQLKRGNDCLVKGNDSDILACGSHHTFHAIKKKKKEEAECIGS